MLIIDSFGRNIYIGDNLIGYINDNKLFAGGKPFAEISDDGVIYYNKKEVGYVDDDYTIYINDQEVGYINDQKDFVFYRSLATTLLGGK